MYSRVSFNRCIVQLAGHMVRCPVKVLQEEFEWLKQLQSIPDAWMRVIFASDSSSYLSSDNHEYEYAIGKVMDARLKSGYS